MNEPGTACYVYGVVPADAVVPEGLTGTDGNEVSLVRHGELAGVVSEIMPEGPLGTREDLLAHEHVVETLAKETTMLPLRFGAVVTSADAVVDEMLAPHHDWFADAIADLAGRMEYTILGTYVEETVLREVLEERPEARRLRENLRDLPEDAGYYERVRLGELVVQALEEKREVDTEELAQALAPYAVAVAPREAAGEDTAADVAFLVDDKDQRRFERAVDELGHEWSGRIRLRMIGPLAPYDFVPSPPEVD
ncbi:GvpL/GvpF family gas vesicle protein [Actinomadura alba]|uniref:GvpL/GvpF family gas vesicle protein n=1 Tax=Actinomadura alba TaxID=406431 RepID=A0ABR7LYC2_9ACTN|nr:GvpL/GvpF family gas vesicle protein [Actinomadura alba]MBC6469544.1 GvpL/GvpF family gas vesicle protein [Actinomadura alba]